MWLCLENPLTLNKCMILVSMKLGGGDRWFVKMSNDSRGVGGSVAYLYPSNLQRLAYTAMKEGNLEVRLTFFFKKASDFNFNFQKYLDRPGFRG